MTRRAIRRQLILLPAALALPVAPAWAQAPDTSGVAFDASGRQRFEVVGASAPACLVSGGASGQGTNATFIEEGSTGGTVQITALADPDSAEGNPVQMQVVLPVICNSAHEIVIRSANGGLLRSGGSRAALGGFVQFVPYRVTYDWAGQSVAGTSDQSGGLDLQVPSPGQGDLTVAITVDGTSEPLVAGSYEDSLQIEITAAN